MSVLLSIETATEVCSCALSHDGEIIIDKENHRGQSHTTLLGIFVDEIMRFARKNNLLIDAIAVSSGPGSYTGLRIGVSEAKGLAYGLNVPLIAIPTPKIMASAIKDKVEEGTLLCPMIDARRMEIYATFFRIGMRKSLRPDESHLWRLWRKQQIAHSARYHRFHQSCSQSVENLPYHSSK
jgi:tRNA threonylcarbamoyladenosine biosynthesis protein TsaB